MLNKAFSKINQYNRALDYSWVKHKAISNNIANVNTPNYKRQKVDFSSVLKKNQIEINKTDSGHMGFSSEDGPRITTNRNTSFRKDDNNVDIDTEISDLVKNQLYYNALTSQLNNKLKRMDEAVKSGR